MYRPILFSTATLPVPNSISRSPLRRVFPVLFLVLGLFTLLPAARAVTPAPDGGYPYQNTAEGNNALALLDANAGQAIGNTAVGFAALFYTTSGDANTGVGTNALDSNTSGNYNTATGTSALVFNVDGSFNTATGSLALANNHASSNTATGYRALYSNNSGSYNTASGLNALYSNSSASYNTAQGYDALFSNTTGTFNTADGVNALLNNRGGNNNSAVGVNALASNISGSNNIGIGYQAGYNLTTGSNNIVIGAGVLGAAGEANTTRIGKSTQAKTLIGGIYGKTVASGTAVAVRIDSTGKLGTVLSSARFKEAIKPMDEASEGLLSLKPVTFRYKEELDPDGVRQFGLIAEEVEKVNPDLVVRDEDGKINTVRYEAVNAMLLNEFLKNHRTDQDQARKLQEQEATITQLKASVMQQQKQIEALTSTIQKVSDQVAFSKPAPQLVANP